MQRDFYLQDHSNYTAPHNVGSPHCTITIVSGQPAFKMLPCNANYPSQIPILSSHSIQNPPNPYTTATSILLLKLIYYNPR